MPVVVSPAEWELAIARAARSGSRSHRQLEQDAEILWGFVDDDDPLVLTRHSVAVTSWYILPRKVIAPRAHLIGTADGFAAILDALGAPHLAAIPRDPVTVQIIDAVEAEDRAAAHHLFVAALDALGVVPPATDELVWGDVMGPVESLALDAATVAVDRAIDAGLVAPSRRGAALSEPSPSGATQLDGVRWERRNWWVGNDVERARLLGPLLERAAQASLADVDAGAATAGHRLVLDAAASRATLTQTGALPRRLAVQAADAFADWWPSGVRKPASSNEMFALQLAFARLRRLGLVRTAHRRLLTTRAGAALAADPAALLAALCGALPVDDRPFVREVAAAVLAGLAREPSRDRAALDREALMITAPGYRDAAGEAPTLQHVTPIVHEVLGELRTLHALAAVDRPGAWKAPPTLTADGLTIALAILDRIATCLLYTSDAADE